MAAFSARMQLLQTEFIFKTLSLTNIPKDHPFYSIDFVILRSFVGICIYVIKMSGSAILFSGKADVVIQNDVSLTSFGIVYQEFFTGKKIR